MFGGKYVWPVPNVDTVNTYEKEIDYLKSWLKQRIAWLDEQLEYDNHSYIETINNDVLVKDIIGYYTLQGIKLLKPINGINIVKYKNGHSKIIYHP